MADKTLIITGADNRYFELARSCIGSLRDKPQGMSSNIAFLDLGCTSEQIHWLSDKVSAIETPNWDFDFPDRESRPLFLRGLLARPFLRRYFPGFEIYLWIDADAWVQRWEAIEWFELGARLRRGLAIVPEVDRSSLRQFGGLPDYWKTAFGWYRNAFGEQVAHALCSFPMLNAGVFALHHEAPHWAIWEACLNRALQSTCTTMTDQIALNFATYSHGLMRQTELLPLTCNWMCHNGFPSWNANSNCLVETYLPHAPVGILHLTNREKEMIRSIATVSGGTVKTNMTYPLQFVD